VVSEPNAEATGNEFPVAPPHPDERRAAKLDRLDVGSPEYESALRLYRLEEYVYQMIWEREAIMRDPGETFRGYEAVPPLYCETLKEGSWTETDCR
jgi:hypothetical protein